MASWDCMDGLGKGMGCWVWSGIVCSLDGCGGDFGIERFVERVYVVG